MKFKSRKSRKSNNRLYLFLPIIILLLIFYFVDFTPVFRKQVSFDWTGIRNEVKDSLVSFVKYERGNDIYDLDEDYDSIQKVPFGWVMRNATNEEFVLLTNHPHERVKLYSYLWAIKSEIPNKKELIIKALNDSTTIFCKQSGCTIRDYLLSEYFYRYYGFPFEKIRLQYPEGHIERLGLGEFSKEDIEEFQKLYKIRILNKAKYFADFYKKQ